MDATVFYAWQSDRPAKINRHLIRRAAQDACNRINADNSNAWTVTLDSDTQGVAGMCDIPNTILEKIGQCDIFLADLTFVGRTEQLNDEPKQMSNANVLFELGYAARAHGFDVLVGVVNEAFGKIDGQVFDIKRRASVTYNVATDAMEDHRKNERNRLSRQLECVLRTTLETVVAKRREWASHNADAEFRTFQTECSTRYLQGNFHGFRQRPAILITIQSSVSFESAFDDLFRQARTKGLNPTAQPDSMFWTTTEFEMAELGLNGVLFQFYCGDYESFKNGYQYTMHSRLNETEDIPTIVRATNVQTNIVRHIQKHCNLLSDLGLRAPWRVGVSLVGANGFRLLVGDSETSNAVHENEIHIPSCVISEVAIVADLSSTAAALRDTLNRLCRHFGLPGSSCFDSDGKWREELSVAQS